MLLRVSTNSQDYEYQRNTLTDICNRNGWEIIHTVENKVSGAKKSEEREEIVELLDYVKNNDVDIVVATEVSRLGRDTLEALKIIEILNENKADMFMNPTTGEIIDKDDLMRMCGIISGLNHCREWVLE